MTLTQKSVSDQTLSQKGLRFCAIGWAYPDGSTYCSLKDRSVSPAYCAACDYYQPVNRQYLEATA